MLEIARHGKIIKALLLLFFNVRFEFYSHDNEIYKGKIVFRNRIPGMRILTIR